MQKKPKRLTSAHELFSVQVLKLSLYRGYLRQKALFSVHVVSQPKFEALSVRLHVPKVRLFGLLQLAEDSPKGSLSSFWPVAILSTKSDLVIP